MKPTKKKKWSKSQGLLSLIQTVDMFPERISLNFNEWIYYKELFYG